MERKNRLLNNNSDSNRCTRPQMSHHGKLFSTFLSSQIRQRARRRCCTGLESLTVPRRLLANADSHATVELISDLAQERVQEQQFMFRVSNTQRHEKSRRSCTVRRVGNLWVVLREVVMECVPRPTSKLSRRKKTDI